VTRPPDFSSRPRRRAASLGDVALFIASLAALAVSASAAWSALRAAGAARIEAVQARREAQRAHETGQGLRRGDASIQGLAGRALLTAEAPPPRVLAALEPLLPMDVRLARVSMKYGARIDVEIQVTARSGGAYDEFMKRLGTSPSFGGVVPETEARDGDVRATISATFTGAAGS
jgi:hypothetical protein